MREGIRPRTMSSQSYTLSAASRKAGGANDEHASKIVYPFTNHTSAQHPFRAQQHASVLHGAP
jgi:hypothetical protein